MRAVTPITPLLPDGCAVVAEIPSAEPPALVHPVWAAAFPWMVQGTTRRGDDSEPFDLGIFSGASPVEVVLNAWERLRQGSGCACVVHARQVHGSEVRVHGEGPPGLHLAGPCDGHVTSAEGVLLAITVADCVPVFVVDPARRAVALLHAGWRGVAAGILERGLAVLREYAGATTADLHVHLGPAICGRCYEVGPEVFERLGLPVPSAPASVDLRAVVALRAVAARVPASRVSVSAHCTRCGDADLFSHRGGDRARQVGYLGIRP